VLVSLQKAVGVASARVFRGLALSVTLASLMSATAARADDVVADPSDDVADEGAGSPDSAVGVIDDGVDHRDVPADGATVADDAAVEVVADVDIDGLIYFRRETFLGFMRQRIGEPLDPDILADDAVEIESQYHARGFLQARVDVEVVESVGGVGGVEDVGSVRAHFTVSAGARSELKAVNIVGNELVPEVDLKEGFFSRPPEPLGVLTRAGLYHRPYLDQDQQRLVYNYYRKGFLEARVTDTRVTASSDLSGLQVTLSVVEGPQYELSQLVIAGELPEGTTDEDALKLRAQVAIKDGDVADLVSIQQQADPLLDAWREVGFPFARFEQALAVGPAPSGAADKKGLSITLSMVKGPQAKVREVRIAGNKGTMPHVFLRELEVVVGQPYRHSDVKRSEKYLMQTGLLLSAAGRALPVPTAEGPVAGQSAVDADGTALVDVEFVVAETTTWLLSPAFFGDANEGLICIGVAGDRNLFGTGLQGFASVQSSPLRFLFDTSLTEPRLFGTRGAGTVEAHRRELRYRDFNVASVFGGSARANYARDLGYRLGGPARVFIGGGLGLEYGGIVPLEEKPLASSTLLPQDTFRNTLEFRTGYDTREGGLSPRNGLLISFDAATAGPWTASGLTFVEGQANVRAFWSPIWNITLKSNSQIGGILNPLGGQAPVTDRYFLGGLGSVRGFFPRSIGPKQDIGAIADVEVGGVVKVVQNVEIEAPIWPDTPFRGFVFCDLGNAFGEAELASILDGTVDRETEFLVANLMMSVGFGILLETPVLPFRFEWSVPVTRREFDQPINFFLGVGSAF
jgi:outer membrane protein insertion porin family